MRAVADSNVVVSGLLWRGPSRALLDLAREGRIELFTSLELLGELLDVLGRPKFQPRLQLAAVAPIDLVVGYASLATRIHTREREPVIAEDPDDDAVLACALAAEADVIISGDRHLLALEVYRGITILTPRRALDSLEPDPG